MSNDPIPKFIADGVSKARIDRLSDLLEIHLRQKYTTDAYAFPGARREDVVGQNQILVCAAPNDGFYSKTVSGHFRGILELADNQEIEPCAHHLGGLLQSGAWFASVSSKNIFGSTLVAHLSQKVSDECQIDEANQELMRTAIEEAVCNGVVHGNLELTSPAMDSFDEFTSFYALIDERIKIPEFGDRYITVQTWVDNSDVWVSVTDEGLGYEPITEKRTQDKNVRSGTIPKEKRRSGRGMNIIRSLTKDVHIDRGGRRMSMKF